MQSRVLRVLLMVVETLSMENKKLRGICIAWTKNEVYKRYYILKFPPLSINPKVCEIYKKDIVEY